MNGKFVHASVCGCLCTVFVWSRSLMNCPRQSRIDSLDSLLQSDMHEAHEARAGSDRKLRKQTKFQDEQRFTCQVYHVLTAFIGFDEFFECVI